MALIIISQRDPLSRAVLCSNIAAKPIIHQHTLKHLLSYIHNLPWDIVCFCHIIMNTTSFLLLHCDKNHVHPDIIHGTCTYPFSPLLGSALVSFFPWNKKKMVKTRKKCRFYVPLSEMVLNFPGVTVGRPTFDLIGNESQTNLSGIYIFRHPNLFPHCV